MANRYNPSEFEDEYEDDEYEGFIPQKTISKIHSKQRDLERRETRRKNARSSGF